MRFNKFDSYQEYVETQQQLSRKKVRRRRVRVFTVPQVVDTICRYYRGFLLQRVDYGCCHGVRQGAEVDMMAKSMGGDWIGTEITPELCDGVKVICADFSLERPEWLNRFDVIYTNSFDHALDPYKTADVWVKSLSPRGRLFVEWNPWSNKLGGSSGPSKADCFAGSLEEYISIFTHVADVETVLEAPQDDPRFVRSLIVVKADT